MSSDVSGPNVPMELLVRVDGRRPAVSIERAEGDEAHRVVHTLSLWGTCDKSHPLRKIAPELEGLIGAL